MSTSELDVTIVLDAPGLPALSLCDDHSVYRLEATTREERQVSFRKQEVTSPFVEGSYLITAVRENVVENVSLYVYGDSQVQMDQRLEAVLERLEVPRYRMYWRSDGVEERWDCQAASYTVRTQREFQYAKMALVKAQIPRLPRITRTYNGGVQVTR